jgi:hypothetical protein
MYLMVVLLLAGFLCNLLVHPVHERHHHESQPARPDRELAEEIP